jgi:hypothetical protein
MICIVICVEIYKNGRKEFIKKIKKIKAKMPKRLSY